MDQIKLFANTKPTLIESSINDWLKENKNRVKVKDIKFVDDSYTHVYTCLVLYEELLE